MLIWKAEGAFDDRVSVAWANDGLATVDGKYPVAYSFTRNGEVIHAGDDMRVTAHTTLPEAMATLAGFVDAWVEALDYADRYGDSDNLGLFPLELRDWAELNHDYLLLETRDDA